MPGCINLHGYICIYAGFEDAGSQQYASEPNRGQTSYSRNSDVDEFGLSPDVFMLQTIPLSCDKSAEHGQYYTTYSPIHSNSWKDMPQHRNFQNQHKRQRDYSTANSDMERMSPSMAALQEPRVQEHLAQNQRWQNQNYVRIS